MRGQRTCALPEFNAELSPIRLAWKRGARILHEHVVVYVAGTSHRGTFAAGGPCGVPGGRCVRDLLLGRDAEGFRRGDVGAAGELLRLFPGADQVGAHFGVVLVHEGGAHVEVATFRSDLEYADGRHPGGGHFETDPRQDALRRDFTINALLLDPVSGEILDFVGGRADLEAQADSRDRRSGAAVSGRPSAAAAGGPFCGAAGIWIEAKTFAAMRRLAPLIRSVAAERVRDEIARILTEGGARRGFELLDSTGLLGEILPEIAAMKGVAQPPEFHPEGDVWTHTLIMLEGLREPSLTLALGVLLHDVGKPGTFRIAERIRFDGHVEKGVEIAHSLLTRLRFPNDVIEASGSADRESYEVHGDAADAREHAEALYAACRISRSIWRCTGWIACRATGIWIITNSCGGSRRRRRRRS